MPDTQLLTPAQCAQLSPNQVMHDGQVITFVPPPSRWQSGVTFVRGVFSDGGEPSSSRILSFILSLAVIVFLGGVLRHVCRLTDTVALGLYLTNLPIIVASLVALMSAPYAINRASGSVSEIISSLRKG